MQTKCSSNGRADSFDICITITAEIHKEGQWYIAYCPEVPEANGQGRTRKACLQSLKGAILLIMEDRREDAVGNPVVAANALQPA